MEPESCNSILQAIPGKQAMNRCSVSLCRSDNRSGELFGIRFVKIISFQDDKQDYYITIRASNHRLGGM